MVVGKQHLLVRKRTFDPILCCAIYNEINKKILRQNAAFFLFSFPVLGDIYFPLEVMNILKCYTGFMESGEDGKLLENYSSW